MWGDITIQNALILCDKNSKFLFEILPDHFPQGKFTDIEAQLWNRYYKQKENRK